MAWAVFARGRKEEELAPRGSYSGGIGEGLEGEAGPVMHGGSRRLAALPAAPTRHSRGARRGRGDCRWGGPV
jgi:hypothetical protein